jgi:hypothetical protein
MTERQNFASMIFAEESISQITVKARWSSEDRREQSYGKCEQGRGETDHLSGEESWQHIQPALHKIGGGGSREVRGRMQREREGGGAESPVGSF